ncbi:MAG TPA: DUF3566 domain-containing protein [bacterium]|jgi:hypothetical protein
MKREILRVEPASAVRIGFVVGLFTGFVAGLVEAVLLKAMSGTPGGSLLPPEAAPLANSSAGTLFLLAIVMGLLFSLIFAFLGALLAFAYNMAARSFGGIEFHMSGDDRPPAREAEAVESPEDEDDV